MYAVHQWPVGHRSGIAMSLTDSLHLGPVGLARTTGALYLSFILASVAADALGHIGLGDAGQLYRAITTAPGPFRVGLVVAFASALLFLAAAWGLYLLLRPAGPGLALLFLLLNAVGVALHSASMLGLVTALLIGDPTLAAPALDAASAQALALLALDTYRTGFAATQLFFGAWLFPLGYLVIRSGIVPRALGVLLILDGIGELVWFVQAIAVPTHPEVKLPGTAVALLAEVGLALWLVVMGARTTPRPLARAGVPAGAAH